MDGISLQTPGALEDEEVDGKGGKFCLRHVQFEVSVRFPEYARLKLRRQVWPGGVDLRVLRFIYFF